MRVVVTGGRAYQYRDKVNRTLSKVRVKYPGLVIVHGDCPTGADRFAQEWCEVNAISFQRMPANWEKHGKGAGPLRNSLMIYSKPYAVIAFPGGTGTADCVKKARAAGIPVWEIK